jgi:hypothetical protein
MEKDIRLEYKGYTSIITRKKRLDGRYSGEIIEPGQTEAMKSWSFTGDNLEEAQERFETQVENIIDYKEFNCRNKQWKETYDYQSIASVFNIHPKVFKERVFSNEFDNSLVQGVKGGDYIVPLYYITKAWDELLKGNLEQYDFMIDSEEDGNSFIDDEELLAEDNATRTRTEAIIQNDEMKILWQELFDIDIDSINLDFKRYDKHLCPNISREESTDYFEDVPDGIVEWIMQGINYKDSDYIYFNSVSCLMEFVAFVITKVRTSN